MNILKKLNAVVLTAGAICLSYGTADDFRINQLGYYPDANKIVPVTGTNDSTFQIVNESGESVFTNTLSAKKAWKFNGEVLGDSVKLADFSSFKQEGIYWIKVADKGMSPPVRINTAILADIAQASLKTFYYQRCSFELEEKFAGKFARKAGHPDTACLFHTSTNKPENSPAANSTGGWYDAGDYGKYVVNAGVTVGSMLSFYEVFGSYFGDTALNIPESKNGIDDLLDEVKFELDWLFTMQDTDGGVFHKLTTLQHAAMVAPNKDTAPRYFIGKTTAATLDFAAIMAMAGRVYKPILPAFADTCINRAESAWLWALANPKEYFRKNPADVGTGAYNDTLISDEFTWAAAELLITTKKEIYKDSLDISRLLYNWPPAWPDVERMAVLSLATVPNTLDASSIATVKERLLSIADKYLAAINVHPYRIMKENFFYWGSNSVFTNAAIAMLYSYKLTDDLKYIKGAAEISDYLLGKNPINYSYVSGYGLTRPENPHHRPSVADTITDPIPGFLVGGPNGSPIIYNDAAGDYQTNEVAINWNSPSTVLFAVLNKYLGGGEYKPNLGPFYLISVSQGPGTITISPVKQKYANGDIVTLTATPEDGQMFLGWNGAAIGITNQVTLKISHDTRISAKFGKPGELVTNGQFNSTSGWSTYKGPSASFTSGLSDDQYKITITNGGTADYHIQFMQSGIQLFEGASYIFKFDARADSNRTLIADIGRASGDYGTYLKSSSRIVNLTPEMQTFTLPFTMKSPTDLGARIVYNAGSSDHDIYIDNVSLMMLDTSPIKRQFDGKSALYRPLTIKRQAENTILGLIIANPRVTSLKLFDLQGRLKCDLTSQIKMLQPGRHSILLNNNFASGIYFIRFNDGKNDFKTKVSLF